MGLFTKDKKVDANEETKTEGKNPFRLPLMISGILLLVLIVSFAGVSIYMKLRQEQEDKKEVATLLAQKEEEQKALEEAAKKQAEEELSKRLEEARLGGYSEGERQVLEQIQRNLDDGASVVEVLRLLYKDQLVVASGGKYHFIPVNPDLKKNNYSIENLVIRDNGELQYMQNGEVTSYKGIDVSKFQGKIDWQKVAEDGVTFAFIRVGYRGYGEKGVLAEDDMARENLQGANEAGVKAGVYFYTQAITREEALEEANTVLELIESYQIDCPVVIDVEKVSASSGRMNALDAATRTEIVKVFCESIEAAGYRPMIYHNLEMGALLLNIDELEQYDKWFAYYKNEFYYPYAFQIWQYSDKGRVQGISGNVDMNIAFAPIWE